MTKKSVYIAYTGGTIGMQRTNQGFAPRKNFFVDEIYKLPELSHDDMPNIVVKEYDQLIDSANISPGCWQIIANDIEQFYDDFDGFVILHGTDTMAYTASALSFMLENLAKPVILTGSQIPLLEIRSDARENLIGALLLAAHYPIPEVCLYFHNRLLRGNRSTKVDAEGFAAFSSPNYPALAKVGADINVNQKFILNSPDQAFSVTRFESSRVSILSIFPGIKADMIAHFLEQSIDGVVLLTYGKGNAPVNDKALMRVFAEACNRGIVIVNCSQCSYGSVNMNNYEAGKALQELGIICGFDLTVEAALTKLYYLHAKFDDKKQILNSMEINIRGELT